MRLRLDKLQSGLQKLNSLEATQAESALRQCCGCIEWTRRMAAARPFSSVTELTETADRVWWSLGPAEWLQAFHSHPKIGEKKATAPTSPEAQKWSENEQAGVRDSAQATIDDLANLNREYEQKFGYIFIICASGKTSEEMLSNLRQRLASNPEDELRIAAGEQAEITRLRLVKLVGTL